MEQPLWSISVICKNEEVSLPNLLDSLQKFIALGGEVIVVDTGSTDRTIEILNEYGFRLISSDGNKLRYEEVGDRFTQLPTNAIHNIYKELIDEKDDGSEVLNPNKKLFNFGEARKYAGSLCTNNWILSVDCDEIVVNLDIPFLNNIIRTGDVQLLSFRFTYKNTKDGSLIATTQRDKFYNRDYCEWRWFVHEQVKPFREIKSAVLSSNVLELDHYQHDAEHRSNYFVGMCIDVLTDPNDQHVFWLGREMLYRGLHYSSVKLLIKYLREYKGAWSAEKCMACIYIWGLLYKNKVL